MREGTYTVHVPEAHAGDPDLPKSWARVEGGQLVLLNGKREPPGLPINLRDVLGNVIYAQWQDDSTVGVFIQWLSAGEWVADLLDQGSELLHLCWDGHYIRLDTRDDCTVAA